MRREGKEAGWRDNEVRRREGWKDDDPPPPRNPPRVRCLSGPQNQGCFVFAPTPDVTVQNNYYGLD